MRRKLTSNLGLKIASVLLAILLWFLVVNAVDPVITSVVPNIKVEIRNPEAITALGKTYTITSSQVISINVDAKKTDWPSIQASDFCAYVDMQYSYGVDEGRQAVQIQIEVVNNKSIIDEDSIELRSGDVMYFTTENIISREIPVEVEQEGELSENYRLNEDGCTVTPGTVTVKAPESVMSRVSRVVAYLDASSLSSDNTEIITRPIVLDANGDEVVSDELTLSTDEVTISTALLLTKSVPVSCEGVTGTPADGYYYNGLSVAPEAVTVVGSRAALANFSISIPAEELNIDQAVSDVVKTVDLAPYLSEGVSVLDGTNAVTVTMRIEQLQSSSYRIPVDQIILENTNPNYEYEVKGTSIVVTLTGLKEDLDVMSANRLIASVDVNGLPPGTYRREVILQLDSGYKQNNTAMVDIEILDPSAPEETETDAPSESEETTAGLPEENESNSE